ncbi:MAG: pentapeptide repeat-containing protein [Rhizomicrobium sp.]
MLKSLYQDPRKALSQQELNAVLLAHERMLSYQRGAAKAELARTKLDRLNLANRNLAEADFSFASLVGAVAFGTTLDRANLHCADLRDCDLTSAKLVKADLRGASICGARLGFARLDGADLRAVTVAYKGPGAAKEGEETYRVDFSNASLKGASFGHAQLEGVNFSGAILEGANFKNARLSNVTFKNAVLTGVNIADLGVPPQALEGCILSATAAAMARAGALVAMLDGHVLCIASGAVQGAQAVLDGEDLRVVRSQFAGKALSGLSARRVLAIGMDFSDCQLQGARFEGADLRDCDFSGADLRGASFRNARLAHAKFEKANLGSLRLPGGKTLAPDFTGADAVRGQFFHAILEDDIKALGLGAPAAIAA